MESKNNLYVRVSRVCQYILAWARKIGITSRDELLIEEAVIEVFKKMRGLIPEK